MDAGQRTSICLTAKFYTDHVMLRVFEFIDCKSADGSLCKDVNQLRLLTWTKCYQHQNKETFALNVRPTFDELRETRIKLKLYLFFL